MEGLPLLIVFGIFYAITDSFIWACVWTIGFLAGGILLIEKIGFGKTVALGVLALLAILAVGTIRDEAKKSKANAEKQRVLAEIGRKEAIVKEYAEREHPKLWKEYMQIDTVWSAKKCATLEKLLRLHSEYVKRKESVERENVRTTKAREDKERQRETLLRDFALKEAPKMWYAYQQLGSETEALDARLQNLKATLISFDIQPENDADYAEISAKRDAMVQSRRTLHEKIQEAYLQACKFAATPESADIDALRRKALEEGVKEAESAAERFRLMMKDK